jgi:hypothetical protein
MTAGLGRLEGSLDLTHRASNLAARLAVDLLGGLELLLQRGECLAQPSYPVRHAG